MDSNGWSGTKKRKKRNQSILYFTLIFTVLFTLFMQADTISQCPHGMEQLDATCKFDGVFLIACYQYGGKCTVEGNVCCRFISSTLMQTTTIPTTTTKTMTTSSTTTTTLSTTTASTTPLSTTTMSTTTIPTTTTTTPSTTTTTQATTAITTTTKTTKKPKIQALANPPITALSCDDNYLPARYHRCEGFCPKVLYSFMARLYVRRNCAYECAYYNTCSENAVCKDRSRAICLNMMPFCTSDNYSEDYRKFRCGVTCNLC